MMCASVALGVGVDDTIHFLTWFRRGIARGLIRQDAVKLAFSRCATAMTQTTIIGGLGLSVFALSAFTPTRRFGYLMLSLLTAALVGDLLLLPALLSGPLGRVFSKRAKKSKSANEAEIETVQASPSALPENAAPHTSSALARSKRQSRRPL
jgi:predicted RND superfamily exporter protein